MTELFGVDIAGMVADALGDGLPEVTITRLTQGARDPGNLSAGRAATSATFTARGFWEDYQPGSLNANVRADDRKAVLIGATIPEGAIPQRGDKITIEGQTLYVIRAQSRDPAGAVLTYQCGDQRGPDGQ